MIDWQQIFIPTNSILEVIVRFLLKRQTGVIGVADLLVIVLIADAAQNAMANEYKSITEGAILVLTIVFWNFAIDWLGYRFPTLQRLTRPPPLPLIAALVLDAAPDDTVSEELNSQLRQQGIEHCSEVKKAFIEGDGSISIIRKDKGETGRETGPLKEIA